MSAIIINIMKKWVILVLIGPLLMMLACQEVEPPNFTQPDATAQPSPPNPEPVPAPMPLPPSLTDAGEFFFSNCASCHGINREGNVGPVLTPESLAALSDAEVKDAILNGRRGTLMPAWKDSLTDEEVDALIQLVRYTSP
ncbi:MAG: cytochrome c [Dehalococcoidales bacterium]|jgi:mono/diheme cytochrome c family protein|nr:cytochrome c [Dehalococcoidales bacterium]